VSHNDYLQSLFPYFTARFRKNKTVYARVGGGDLASDSEEWMKVEEVVSARMNVYTFQNDIALVKIASGHQQVIQRAKKMPSNTAECVIYGYGTSSYQTNTITSNVVRYGRVNLISYKRCEEIVGRVTAPTPGTRQFCALGINGADTCFGKL
jgi:Trypsin